MNNKCWVTDGGQWTNETIVPQRTQLSLGYQITRSSAKLPKNRVASKWLEGKKSRKSACETRGKFRPMQMRSLSFIAMVVTHRLRLI